MMTTEEKMTILRDSYETLRRKGKVKTQQEFAAFMGVDRSTMSKAFNGNDKYLTDRAIRRIQSKMEGEYETEPFVLPLDANSQKDMVLVIPTGARGGSIGDWSEGVTAQDCERMVSPIRGADYAIQITGDSMAPEYPNGSLAIIKRVDPVFIEWGSVYVLDTPNGAVIKRIFKTDDPEIVECVSINKEYQSFEVPRKLITQWFKVLMSLSLK